MQASAPLVIHKGYLRSSDDMTQFIADVSYLCERGHKAGSKHAEGQLWHSLTGSMVNKHIYKVAMPFLLKGVLEDCAANLKRDLCKFMLFPRVDIPAHGIALPEASQKKEAAFLLSATLYLQIRSRPDDFEYKKEYLWTPPRDFQALSDETPMCYVELFLKNLRYVSDLVEDVPAQPSWFEYALGKAPESVQKAWVNFKETFLVDDSDVPDRIMS